MSILIWILLGTVAGSLAKSVMPGPRAGGMKVAIPLGIAGALIGGFSGAALAGELSMQIDPRSLVMALIAALAVLFSYRSYVMRWEAAPLWLSPR